MTRQAKKPKTRTIHRRKPLRMPTRKSLTFRVNPSGVYYGRKKDGSITVRSNGSDCGEMRPSKQFPGCYYASVFSFHGYMLTNEELRVPVELSALKNKVEQFLSACPVNI